MSIFRRVRCIPESDGERGNGGDEDEDDLETKHHHEQRQPLARLVTLAELTLTEVTAGAEVRGRQVVHDTATVGVTLQEETKSQEIKYKKNQEKLC